MTSAGFSWSGGQENGRTCGRCGDLHPWDAVKCECGCLLVMSARDPVLAKAVARPEGRAA